MSVICEGWGGRIQLCEVRAEDVKGVRYGGHGGFISAWSSGQGIC